VKVLGCINDAVSPLQTLRNCAHLILIPLLRSVVKQRRQQSELRSQGNSEANQAWGRRHFHPTLAIYSGLLVLLDFPGSTSLAVSGLAALPCCLCFMLVINRYKSPDVLAILFANPASQHYPKSVPKRSETIKATVLAYTVEKQMHKKTTFPKAVCVGRGIGPECLLRCCGHGGGGSVAGALQGLQPQWHRSSPYVVEAISKPHSLTASRLDNHRCLGNSGTARGTS
jgi:hypothetical protein